MWCRNRGRVKRISRLISGPADQAGRRPYGPYADGFSETQHKYGPFGPIETEDRRLRAEQSKSK
jgi:thiosulfate dehydrogenase